MHEYQTKAVVLSREPLKEADSRVYCFTEKYGKMIARARSARKITSKLSGHLEPGSIIRARFIEKRGLQIVDALKLKETGAEHHDLMILERVLPEWDPDENLWKLLLSKNFTIEYALKLLGYGQKHAVCNMCNANKPRIFYVHDQSFFCNKCASKIPSEDVIYMKA